jgi:hypothetical protein
MFLGVLAFLRTDRNRTVRLNAGSNCTDKSDLMKIDTGEFYYNFTTLSVFHFCHAVLTTTLHEDLHEFLRTA